MEREAGPTVSAILPAYNAESFIRDSIESVLKQTYRRLELIVVDDGSTDATGDVIAQYARRDPRVLHLRQPNRGVAAARNLAISSAGGDYIAPIDADDVWFPEKIARQVKALESASPETGVAYAWSRRIDASGQVFPETRPRPEIRGWVYPAFIYKNFCSASAPLIRRECLEAVGGYDPELRALGGEGCEDLDLLLRLAERYAFELVREYQLAYRQRIDSMSSNTAAMERSFQIVMARACERRPEVPARIRRWALSEFYLHLMNSAKRLGDHSGVLVYACRAMRSDPTLACVPYLHRNALCALIRLMRGDWRTDRVDAPRVQSGVHREPGIIGRWRERIRFARFEFVCRAGQARKAVYNQPPVSGIGAECRYRPASVHMHTEPRGSMDVSK